MSSTTILRQTYHKKSDLEKNRKDFGILANKVVEMAETVAGITISFRLANRYFISNLYFCNNTTNEKIYSFVNE